MSRTHLAVIKPNTIGGGVYHAKACGQKVFVLDDLDFNIDEVNCKKCEATNAYKKAYAETELEQGIGFFVR